VSEKVFKGVEIVGTSDKSFSQAIEVAVARARQTLRELSWFVVEEMRGGLQQGRLEYQVTLRVFFRLDDGTEGDAAGSLRGSGLSMEDGERRAPAADDRGAGKSGKSSAKKRTR
jgi:flavin-binding protein dodecin